MSAVFALYLGNRGSLRRQLALFEAALLLLALASAALALGFPSLGLDASTGHSGNWQGVFTQKNACGRAMVFATAILLAQGRPNWRRACSAAVFLIVLAMSGSRGAWVIEALLLTVVLVHWGLSRVAAGPRALLTVCTLGVGGVLAALGKLYFPLLATMLGRDPTLTGRTAIWAQVWLAILKRPWLGYGFSAFWRGTRGASFDVVVALKFVLFHAHNGFLEIWLELGAAGLLLFVFSYMRGWARLWPQLQNDARSDRSTYRHRGQLAAQAWPLYILVLIAAYNVDENTLLSFNGLFWVLYVHALVTIELGSRRTAGVSAGCSSTVPWIESAGAFDSAHAAPPGPTGPPGSLPAWSSSWF